MANRFEEQGKDSSNFTLRKVVTIPLGAEIELSGFICKVVKVKNGILILKPVGNVTFKRGDNFDVEEIVEEL